jgi:hypothetical protein
MAGDATDLHVGEERRLAQERPSLARPRLQVEGANRRRDELRMHQLVPHLQGLAEHEEVSRLKRPDGESIDGEVQLRSDLLRRHLHRHRRTIAGDRNHHGTVQISLELNHAL